MFYDSSLPDGLICDIDGTLALLNGRNPYNASTCNNDMLNGPIAGILLTYQKSEDCHILLVTGRYEKYRPETENWLWFHGIHGYALFMRPDGDNRKDYELKREIYERHILGRYTILFALDDRAQSVALWRFLGLTCLQVANN